MSFTGRTLFVALGGTGGRTLLNLYEKMTPEQKDHANMLYLDLDEKDIEKLRGHGVETVQISTSSTVGRLAERLRESDGALDWLPSGPMEQVFASINLNQGAGQYRYISRLCLARFLKNPANRLVTILQDMQHPGKPLRDEDLRVVIVSSVAGGTGAGTFIEVALYIRKYLRSLTHDNNIRIIGILGLPALYENAVRGDENPKYQINNMRANAYAAIRELNAMNICASGDRARRNDYGKNIRINIDTRSEGKLFDSTDPEFTGNYKSKPFDLIYFIDNANQDGGILSDTREYYNTMAEIAYTRLYSALEPELGSLEVNELAHHIDVPTAIYGSAGYARLQYPYEQILQYLAERKTSDEVNLIWQKIDLEWESYVDHEQTERSLIGLQWEAPKGLRAREFIKSIDTELNGGLDSPFSFLREMLIEQNATRFDNYLTELKKSVGLFGGEEGKYSVLTEPDVMTLYTELQDVIRRRGADDSDAYVNKVDVLQRIMNGVKGNWDAFCDALEGAVEMQASRLSSAIFPLREELNVYTPVNIRYGLLQVNRQDVHPLAARYLLYKLYKYIEDETDNLSTGQLGNSLDGKKSKLNLAFDEDLDDGKDFTNEMKIQALNKIRLNRKRDAIAGDALERYIDIAKSCVSDAVKTTNNYILRAALKRVKSSIAELVGQYEGFFENLDHYKNELAGKVRRHETEHDRDYDQYIYVGATAAMKRFYYSVQPNTRNALNRGSRECYASAGASVFEELANRTRKKVEMQQLVARGVVQDNADNPDDFNGLSHIFDDMVKKYKEYLRENANYLNTDVIGAMVHQICKKKDIEEQEVAADGEIRRTFIEEFRNMLDDLKLKALPLLRYSEDNTEGYFAAEEDPTDRNYPYLVLSQKYSFLGIGEETARMLVRYFGDPNENDVEKAVSDFQVEAGIKSIVHDDSFSKYEIRCFGAVHCLQPTQIYHFNERSEDCYYEAYEDSVSKAVSTGTLSQIPHLDKRWYLKSVMPFISRKLEIEWREKVMKAFLFEIINRELRYTTAQNRKVFVYLGRGAIDYIHSKDGQPVLTRDISRTIEELSDDEFRVMKDAGMLDKLIEQQILELSNYTDTAGLYKAGMTKNEMLRRMREEAILYYQPASERHGRNAGRRIDGVSRAEREKTLAIRRAQNGGVLAEDEEDESVVDLRTTLGGILKIAYMVKTSEEGLGEDRDDAEVLLRIAAYVIDRFSQAMNGTAHVNAQTIQHREYVEIYNHAIDKMLQAYAEAECRLRRYAPDQITVTLEDEGLYKESITSKDGTDRGIPLEIRNTPEYIWIREHWKHKAE